MKIFYLFCTLVKFYKFNSSKKIVNLNWCVKFKEYNFIKNIYQLGVSTIADKTADRNAYPT